MSSVEVVGTLYASQTQDALTQIVRGQLRLRVDELFDLLSWRGEPPRIEAV
jgi:hypothetical protein